MNKDLISIIIPIYNVASYLDRCMKSVLEQSYSNLEIILVDDGATDESGVMCDEYASKDSRINVIHQDNRGLSAARNAGTMASKGKYICFVDPDDEVDVQYVELLYDAMVSNGVSLAMCSFFTIFEKTNMSVPVVPCEVDTNPAKSVIVINSNEYIKNYVERKKTSVTAWSRMYSTELAHKVLFPEDRVYEDQATHIQFVTCVEKIAVVSRPLYKYYKQAGDSITGTISEKKIQDRLWAYQTTYDQIIHFDPRYTERAKWLIDEAPLAILIDIYMNYGRNEKKKYNALIYGLRRKVRSCLIQGAYRRRFFIQLMATIVCVAPNLLPVLWEIRNVFRRNNN